MKQAMSIKVLTLMVFFLSAPFLYAGNPGQITLESKAKIEKLVFNEEGMQELKSFPADRVIPGDEVIFSNDYKNITKSPVEKVVITNPVPEHMIYRAGTASGKNTIISFSVDNGKTYAQPEKLIISDVAGNLLPAKASDYTHIRWAFAKPLQPGASGQVSFAAILK